MDDLVTWLRAQLDEDERGRLLLADQLEKLAAELDQEAQENEDQGGYTEPQVYRWAAQHIRDRAAELVEEYRSLRLAEVDAKRRVTDVLRGFEPNDEWGTQSDMGLRRNNAAGALRALALPYADRPGYRDEWRL